MSIFTGSAVAIITPFDENGVKKDVFRQLIDYQLQQGTDAIVVCGTTGEPSTMNEDEKKDAISCCIEHVAGRVPVIVGTGGNNTAKAIADSIQAQNLGADALLIVTPYYNKCTQGGLVEHYTAIANSVKIPIIVYNVPSRTSVNVLPETMQKLSTHPNIVAIKEASGDIAQIVETARLCPEIDLYSGNDDHVVPLLALGGKGVISVDANVIPNELHEIVASFLRGDLETSRSLQFKIAPLNKVLFSEVNPIPVKTAVRMLGLDVGEVRLPLTPLTENNCKLLEKEMKALGIFERLGEFA